MIGVHTDSGDMISCSVQVNMAAVATFTTALLIPGQSTFPRTNAGGIALGHRYRIPATVPSRLACRGVRDSESEREPALFLPQVRPIATTASFLPSNLRLFPLF